MIEILDNIKNRLLSNIAIFDAGYSYARIDENKGFVATMGNEAKYVSINDTEGNYFYIRVPNMSNAAVSPSLSDCAVRVSERFTCTLITITRDTDPLSMYDAVLNELLKSKTVNFKGGSVDPVYIVEQEFKGLKKESVESAKSRIGNMIITRHDFDIVRYFDTHNCEYNLCPQC